MRKQGRDICRKSVVKSPAKKQKRDICRKSVEKSPSRKQGRDIAGQKKAICPTDQTMRDIVSQKNAICPGRQRKHHAFYNFCNLCNKRYSCYRKNAISQKHPTTEKIQLRKRRNLQNATAKRKEINKSWHTKTISSCGRYAT